MQKFIKLTAITKTALILIVLMALPTIYALAGHGDSPADAGGDPGAPIDGGISLLVAAGIGYGAKKVKDARKKTTSINPEETKE